MKIASSMHIPIPCRRYNSQSCNCPLVEMQLSFSEGPYGQIAVQCRRRVQIELRPHSILSQPINAASAVPVESWYKILCCRPRLRGTNKDDLHRTCGGWRSSFILQSSGTSVHTLVEDESVGCSLPKAAASVQLPQRIDREHGRRADLGQQPASKSLLLLVRPPVKPCNNV